MDRVASALPNPFRPRSTADPVFGREHQLSIGQQLLDPVLAAGAPAQGTLVMFGVRGIGKTSLLRELASIAGAQGFVTAWVSAPKGGGILDSLALAVQTALLEVGVTSAATWQVTSASAELGVPGLKTSITASRSSPAAHSKWTVARLEILLRAAALAAREHGGSTGAGLLLCIDELHAANLDELSILLGAVQNITNDFAMPVPFAMFGAGLPRVRGVVTTAATFGERSQFVEVGALPLEVAEAALRETSLSGGVDMADDAAQLLASRSGGYPFFVQLLGWHAWAQERRSPGSTITLAEAERAAIAMRPEVVNLFEARLGSASASQQAFLVAIAKVAGDGPAKRESIAAEMGVKTNSLSMLRRELLDKAIVIDVGRGLLQFTLPGFADYVLDTLDG